MSLHQLANHMSARGRGPDSTLVHMTPREVEGLQKLALAHGTSLTINPQTGLPEAFSLQDLLPTLAGAAINYFAPGFGTAIGGALGLSGAAGTGLAVGAATAALSGDLGKGLQAGLGAYGGAGITEGLMGLGTGALSAEVDSLGYEGEQLAQNAIASKLANASKFDTLSAGAANAMSNPGNALSAFGGGSKLKGGAILASALSPMFADRVADTVQTVTPRQSAGMIRPFTYDPHYQEYTRGTPYAAAKGGLMGLAHGGAVHYEEGGPVGAAVPFNMDDYLRDYVKRFEPLAATNTGQGFSATAAPVTQATPVAAQAAPAPVARVAETAPLAAAQVFPTAQATPAAPVAETAPAPVAQVSPQAPQYSPPDFFDTGKDIQDVRRTFAEQLAKDNAAKAAAAGTGIAALSNAGATTVGTTGATGIAAIPPLTDQVYDLFMNTVDRPPSESDMAYWKTQFGINNNTIDPNEIADFKSAASGEISRRQASTSGKDYTLNTDANREALYQSILNRSGEKAGMDFWKQSFGDYIDPTELAGFKTEAAKEIAKRPVVVNPVVQNPAVVTDLTTAGTQYIAPGVGGSTGAGQVGGGTTINPNGTITTSPRISGIPVGGFTGMQQVRDAYTTGGGSLGYTSPTYTAKEFADKYKNTGYQKEMYDYLMGKGDMPTKMKNADGTYREIMRPYNEATLGVPGSTNKRLTWDKTKGEYFRNPDYVRTAKAPILDAAGKQKRDADGNYLYNTTTYKSINQAKAGLAENKLDKDSGSALLDWATQNNIDEQTVADALGIPLQDVTSKFAKVKSETTAKVKKGGLLSLARGGMAYDNGGSVKPDFTNSKGEVFLWDWENGEYRPKEMTKDGKSYTWDKISNRYKPAGVGIAGLLDMSGGSPAGGENAPNTTPDWGTTFQIGKTLSNMGLTTAGNYLERAATNGILGQSNAAAKEADALPSTTAGDYADPSTVTGAPALPSTTAGDYADPSTVTGAPTDPNAGSNTLANGGYIGRYAQGGLGSLGGYSDGGRLLRGPGNGVSDDIPATIGAARQPARLADGEFVVPARIVSELGNGSTEAGARALYKMMDRIQANRRKTTGKNSVAVDSKAHKYLPA